MIITEFLETELNLRGKLADTGWYRACCPIHKERSPSFAVFTEHPYVFNCLACGAHGTLPELVAQLREMSRPEAVEFIRDRLSIELGDVEARLFKDTPQKRVPKPLLRALQDSLPNTLGAAYCAGRDVPGYILHLFNVGYETMTERLMIPLFSIPDLKHAVGFDIRCLGGEEVYKLVDVAPGQRRRSLICPVDLPINYRGVIPVEGFFDAARVLQWLIEYKRLEDYIPVAICGNKVSEHHAAFFSRFDNICLGFDNDAGGEQAIERVYQLLPERSFRRLIFPMKDPGESDSFSIAYI